jgi:hypothetical protein
MADWSRAVDDSFPCHEATNSSPSRMPRKKLPAAEQQIAEWQAAVDALLLIVELDGPTMMARIGVMRALTSSECSIQLVNATRQWFII